MKFLNQLLLIPLLTGPIFMVAGIILKKFPPRQINALYGYRTNWSMKSQERWNFAQTYSAREMIKLGSLLLVTSFLGLALNLDEEIEIVIGLSMMIMMVALLFVRTEKAIKQKFGKE